MSQAVAPVLQKERIDILDSLRGIAILGILLMNIPGLGYSVAGGDPFLKNEVGTINYTIWYYVSLIPDGTQRALFSMLFGAGIILFTSSKSKQHDKLAVADSFFRRQIWLIVFGLVNIYIFLWSGDILFDYGCYGLLMFVCRLWEPKKLLIGGTVCFILMLARENRDLYLDKRAISEGEKVERMDTTQVKLTERQKEYLTAMKEGRESTLPEQRLKRMSRGQRMMTSNHGDVYDARVSRYLGHLVTYTYFGIWDVLLFMFIGMAFFKMGILSGKAPAWWYGVMCVVGLGAGLWFSYLHLKPLIDAKFNRFEHTKNITLSFYEAGRMLRTFGIFGLVMLMYKSGLFQWFFKLMRPVGQMAFTNYLTQSISGAIIFYGFGFALFGQLQRYEVYLVVLAIWVVQIIWSHIWLNYFQYGPFEWVWRQLTYWKRLPIKKNNSE